MSTEEVKALVEALRVCASAGACKTCERDLYCEPTKMLSDAAAAIEALQSETVRLWPKRGKWINSKERMRPDMCSVCGCIYEADRFMDKIAWNYCPNCGADMRKMEVQDADK